MNKSISDINIHFMHENGMGFVDIARVMGITPKEVATAFVKVDAAKTKAKNKEKIVYRKRLSNTNVKSRHQKLVEKMKTL